MSSPAGNLTTGDSTTCALRRGKLMIVDDDPAVLEALDLALTWQGHEVVMAEGGKAAVEAACSIDLDLVLTDFKMGGMDGLETMLAIKAVKPDVPVMIITGFASAEMEDELKRSGAFGVITKPFMLDDLYAAVQRALEPL